MVGGRQRPRTPATRRQPRRSSGGSHDRAWHLVVPGGWRRRDTTPPADPQPDRQHRAHEDDDDARQPQVEADPVARRVDALTRRLAAVPSWSTDGASCRRSAPRSRTLTATAARVGSAARSSPAVCCSWVPRSRSSAGTGSNPSAIVRRSSAVESRSPGMKPSIVSSTPATRSARLASPSVVAARSSREAAPSSSIDVAADRSSVRASAMPASAVSAKTMRSVVIWSIGPAASPIRRAESAATSRPSRYVGPTRCTSTNPMTTATATATRPPITSRGGRRRRRHVSQGHRRSGR